MSIRHCLEVRKTVRVFGHPFTCPYCPSSTVLAKLAAATLYWITISYCTVLLLDMKRESGVVSSKCAKSSKEKKCDRVNIRESVAGNSVGLCMYQYMYYSTMRAQGRGREELEREKRWKSAQSAGGAISFIWLQSVTRFPFSPPPPPLLFPPFSSSALSPPEQARANNAGRAPSSYSPSSSTFASGLRIVCPDRARGIAAVSISKAISGWRVQERSKGAKLSMIMPGEQASHGWWCFYRGFVGTSTIYLRTLRY